MRPGIRGIEHVRIEQEARLTPAMQPLALTASTETPATQSALWELLQQNSFELARLDEAMQLPAAGAALHERGFRRARNPNPCRRQCSEECDEAPHN